jgi:hypothetical protein
MDGKPQIQAELKHQMGTKWPGGASWTRHPLTLRIKGSMPNGTTRFEGTLGMMLEAMLGRTLEATLGLMLGKAKMETSWETTAKMRTGFLILVAAHDLQKLPAWLKLEKLRFVSVPCHPTWDLHKNFRQRRTPRTTEAVCMW